MEELICLNPFTNRAKVHETILALQSQSSHEYFVSAGWVETWLDCLPSATDLRFVAKLEQDKPVCCYFLGRRRGFEHRIFYRLRGYFNTCGVGNLDINIIEYNSALSSGESCLGHLFWHPEFADIEELHFQAVTKENYDALNVPITHMLTRNEVKPSYYVDLNAIRKSGEPYLNSLSKSGRSQIRRSIREYELSGNIKIIEAASTDEAKVMLSRLQDLHQQKWTRRGFPGAFSSEFFKGFHQALINKRFDSGEIQLLEISSADDVIGYLYNFVYQNRVLYYQSGFNYGDSNLIRPGLVCHYHAILHNLAIGRDSYNFLAGETRYKKSLATNHDNLYYVTVARKDWKTRLERQLRRFKKSLQRS